MAKTYSSPVLSCESKILLCLQFFISHSFAGVTETDFSGFGNFFGEFKTFSWQFSDDDVFVVTLWNKLFCTRFWPVLGKKLSLNRQQLQRKMSAYQKFRETGRFVFMCTVRTVNVTPMRTDTRSPTFKLPSCDYRWSAHPSTRFCYFHIWISKKLYLLAFRMPCFSVQCSACSWVWTSIVSHRKRFFKIFAKVLCPCLTQNFTQGFIFRIFLWFVHWVSFTNFSFVGFLMSLAQVKFEVHGEKKCISDRRIFAQCGQCGRLSFVRWPVGSFISGKVTFHPHFSSSGTEQFAPTWRPFDCPPINRPFGEIGSRPASVDLSHLSTFDLCSSFWTLARKSKVT